MVIESIGTIIIIIRRTNTSYTYLETYRLFLATCCSAIDFLTSKLFKY
jgi:hypothetical protein